MFKQPNEQQLQIISTACERDAETTLHSKLIQRYADQRKIRCFFIKEHLVGFVIEEPIPPEAELIQLFIFSEFRGSGFGTVLLENWLESLTQRHYTKALLEVREGNLPAISIYHKCGFQTVARRHNYYQLNLGTFDALLMDKDLTLQGN